jgi:hypothetical protein
MGSVRGSILSGGLFLSYAGNRIPGSDFAASFQQTDILAFLKPR